MVRIYDHENFADPRMLGERGEAARQHRRAADGAVLLRPIVLICRPRASACRHDERRDGHEIAPAKRAKSCKLRRLAPVSNDAGKMLHCGKTNIARAAKPPYCAQLKFMGYSCIKIVHRRSQAPAPRRKGYTA
jgi:hypothetical protein